MKKLLWLGLLVSLLVPVSATAQSVFDGTWKFDISKAQLPKKPDVYLIQAGMYSCKTCVPSYEVKADGQDQKVTGQPYFDSLSVKVIDDRTIEMTQKRMGRSTALQSGQSRLMATLWPSHFLIALPPTPTPSRARANRRE